MKTYGLIGKKLSHSFSQTYFDEKFESLGIEAKYFLFEVGDVSEVKEIIRSHPELVGLNVTIPYKEDILSIVDEVDPVAQAVGSVNTLKIYRAGEEPLVHAFNTDVIGFEKTLSPLTEDRNSLSALVLGTGGAAKAVVYVLQKLRIPFRCVSRNPVENQLGYSDLTEELILEHGLIINTTPVGMYPQADVAPEIPYSFLTRDHILYDLIYNPAETIFLRKGREKGCVTMNGQRMLELQADASWEIWKD
ncbi:MAG: shikimate dehydrogenase [Bacteroidetes bacterium]|nr:MAG: shikimate dehydrogenase [Bacteroidota bacterium]